MCKELWALLVHSITLTYSQLAAHSRSLRPAAFYLAGSPESDERNHIDPQRIRSPPSKGIKTPRWSILDRPSFRSDRPIPFGWSRLVPRQTEGPVPSVRVKTPLQAGGGGFGISGLNRPCFILDRRFYELERPLFAPADNCGSCFPLFTSFLSHSSLFPVPSSSSSSSSSSSLGSPSDGFVSNPSIAFISLILGPVLIPSSFRSLSRSNFSA